jgi:hypothetical protein
MEIGDLCKINMDDLVYKITNSKTKNVTLRPDKDTTPGWRERHAREHKQKQLYSKL